MVWIGLTQASNGTVEEGKFLHVGQWADQEKWQDEEYMDVRSNDRYKDVQRI